MTRPDSAPPDAAVTPTGAARRRIDRRQTRRTPSTLSPRAVAAVLASSGLPVLAVAVFIGAPIEWGLLVVFLVPSPIGGLFIISGAEFVVGLVARRRLLCLDGAVRALLTLALVSPLGGLSVGFVPIAWSFVQSFDPAYACRAAACEDAIVDTITLGGAMLTPQCYIELVRLSDPRGGRVAAIRVLRRAWPSFGPAEDDAYAVEAGLMSLGRGFYRADRCEAWDDPRSMREEPGHRLA